MRSEEKLFSVAGIGAAVADGYATVDGLDVDGWAAAAKVGVEVILDLALDGDGEINGYAAVHGAGFEVGGVGIGNTKIDAAIGGVGLEAFTLPAIAGERDIESAVGGVALDVAGKLAEINTAIGGGEANGAIEAGEVDAAIHGVKFGGQMAGHAEVIVDAVAGVAEEAVVRAMVADFGVASVDDDLVEEVIRS